MAEESIELYPHPEYLEHLPEWINWRNCYVGGESWRRPDVGGLRLALRPTAHVRMDVEDGLVHVWDLNSPSTVERARVRASETVAAPIGYLVPHERETPETYDRRVSMALWYGLAAHVIDLIVEHTAGLKVIFSEAWNGDALMQRYRADVTRTGTPLELFEEELLAWAEVFSIFYVGHELVSERPVVASRADGVPTAEDVEAAGSVVRSYMIRPMDLIGWQYDPTGTYLVTACVREATCVTWALGKEPAVSLPRYRMWDSMGWQIWIEDGENQSKWPRKIRRLLPEENGNQPTAGTHKAGRVPIHRVMALRSDPTGQHPMRRLYDAEVMITNINSERRQTNRDLAWAQLAVDETVMEDIQVGSQAVLPLREGGPPPQLLEPAGNAFNKLSAELDSVLGWVRMFAGISRASEGSLEERSGKALGIEGGDKDRKMARRAAQRVRQLADLIDMVHRVARGTPAPDELKQATIDDLQLDALGAKMQRLAEQIKELPIAPAVQHAVAAGVERRLVDEYVPLAERAGVVAKAKKWHEAETEKPAPMPPPGPPMPPSDMGEAQKPGAAPAARRPPTDDE